MNESELLLHLKRRFPGFSEEFYADLAGSLPDLPLRMVQDLIESTLSEELMTWYDDGEVWGLSSAHEPEIQTVISHAARGLGKTQKAILAKLLEAIEPFSGSAQWEEISLENTSYDRLSKSLAALERRRLIIRESNPETQSRGRVHTVRVRLTLLGYCVALRVFHSKTARVTAPETLA